ncbi:MAG: MFS transporter, partial [Ignavibacteriae bacterium]|nr:MFS transporter [Ignavibacteriota bacterium]
VLVTESLISIVSMYSAGSLSERKNPSLIIKNIQIIRGLLIALIALILYTSYSIYFLPLVNFLVRFTKPYYKSGLFILQGEIFPKKSLRKMYSSSNIMFYLGQILGIACAGFLLTLNNLYEGILVSSAFYFISGLNIVPITKTNFNNFENKPTVLKKKSSIENWFVLIVDLVLKKYFLYLLVASSINLILLIGLKNILAPIVNKNFSNSSYWMSILDAALILGCLISSYCTGKYLNKYSMFWINIFSLLGQILILFLLGIVSQSFIIVMFFFVVGFLNTVSWIQYAAYVQLECNSLIRGKIVQIRDFLAVICTALFMPFLAFLNENSVFNAVMGVSLMAISSVAFFVLYYFIKMKEIK